MSKEKTVAHKRAEKPTLLPVQNYRSSGKWEAHKNTSWGERHKSQFGERAGYVIGHHNKHHELITIASVIGMPFVEQKEIDANAKLIESAPALLGVVEKLALLDEGQHGDIAELIQRAKGLVGSLFITNQ